MRETIKQHKRLYRCLKKTYKRLFRLMSRLPVKKDSIVFESFRGVQYSCNPRAIYEYMRQYHPHFRMVWSVDKRYVDYFEKHRIPYVKRSSIRWMFWMARAQYWVTNSRLPLWLPKPKHTTYVQTWHGTTLKKLAGDMDEVHMPGTDTVKYKRNFFKESGKWDVLISPNAYSTDIFRRAFLFGKTLIETGYPRNDYLYTHNNRQAIEQLKTTYDIPKDKKVLLYAPTWRDDQSYEKGRYKFDLPLDLNLLKQKLGEEYVVILRMHYLVAENFDLSPYEGFVYDYSTNVDIRDLYLISDLLITDYSSVFFDYANLRRPIVFYMFDIDQYRDTLRGFYFDIEKNAPGPIVKTTEEVVEAIESFAAQNFAVPPSFHPFYDKFCYLEDGEATKRVVERVFLGKDLAKETANTAVTTSTR